MTDPQARSCALALDTPTLIRNLPTGLDAGVDRAAAQALADGLTPASMLALADAIGWAMDANPAFADGTPYVRTMVLVRRLRDRRSA